MKARRPGSLSRGAMVLVALLCGRQLFTRGFLQAVPSALLRSSGRGTLSSSSGGGSSSSSGDEELDIDDFTPQQVADLMKEPTFKPDRGATRKSTTLEATEPLHIMVQDGFLSESLSGALRGKFEEHFSDSKQASPERFCFDYWHVRNQYTLLRTPAANFFGGELFDQLADEICSYGQQCLGTSSITPPWLSLYIDGCEQKWHVDGWHGPFAYVYSLSSDPLTFSGGETQIIKPHVLDYWSSAPPGVGLEMPHLMESIRPEFNRLSVFDPRIPHSVAPVRDTGMDPLRGRLVVHGWFTDPQPYFEGGLEENSEHAEETLSQVLLEIGEELSGITRLMGTVAVRAHVKGESGNVDRLEVLSDTLVPDPTEVDGWESREEALKVMSRKLKSMKFVPAPDDTRITIPFVFS